MNINEMPDGLDIGISLSGDQCISEIPRLSPLSFLRNEDGRRISRLCLPKASRTIKASRLSKEFCFK